MENTFDNFIKELKELFDAEKDFRTIIDESLDLVEYNDEANRLAGDACEYLITSDGDVNYKNIRILEFYGFKVYPGESDSFGWLTGVIERNNRKLVFG